MEMKKVAEEQEIWNKEEEAAKSEVEAKKLVVMNLFLKVGNKNNSCIRET